MPIVPLSLNKGRRSAGPRLRLPPGFLRKCQDAVYLPDDPEQLHKIPGRSNIGDFPGAATAVNTKGLQLLQFSTGDDQLVLLANSQLYETAAGTSLAAFASVNDAQGSPQPFARAGSFLKVIGDPWKRCIVWTGDPEERPLIRDEDGNWRLSTLNHPGPLALTATTDTPTFVRPDSTATPVTVAEGTVDGGFTNPSRAYDADDQTFAQAADTEAAIYATNWSFADGGMTSSQRLFVKLASSSLIFPDLDDGGQAEEIPEPLVANVFVRVSETGAGGTFSTVFTGQLPLSAPTIQVDLTDGTLWTNVVVQVVYQYVSGTSGGFCYVREIYAHHENAGSATVVDAGTYKYAVTEQYKVVLESGRTIVVESSPSDIAEIELDGTTHTGVSLTLPARANPASDGVDHDPDNNKLLVRRVYRTTKSGSFPDLGYIGNIGITETTFIDNFETDGITLGTPSLQVVYAGDAAYVLAGQGPAVRDATLHRGAFVCIPADDPYRIRWTPRGFPEYWPFPHDFSFLGRIGNDEAQGIVSVGDALVIFFRSQVARMRDLPMATSFNFDIEALEVDTLSHSEGLAGTPKSYTLFHSQQGHAVVAWVSDSGIWMTDGTLISERGMGVVKVSTNMDWTGDVDTSRLDETALSFDAVLGVMIFDYYDPDGVRRTQYFHTSAIHWIGEGGVAVPKLSGPHSLTALDRTIGENDGVFRHWSINPSQQLKVRLERNGAQDAGSDILTHIETEWIYPVGSRRSVQIYEGGLYHSDWGANEACDVDILTRRDETGIVQSVAKTGIPLRGERSSSLGYINKAGQAFKVIIRHSGKTSSLVEPARAFDILELEIEPAGEVQKD